MDAPSVGASMTRRRDLPSVASDSKIGTGGLRNAGATAHCDERAERDETHFRSNEEDGDCQAGGAGVWPPGGS